MINNQNLESLKILAECFFFVSLTLKVLLLKKTVKLKINSLVYMDRTSVLIRSTIQRAQKHTKNSFFHFSPISKLPWK